MSFSSEPSSRFDFGNSVSARNIQKGESIEKSTNGKVPKHERSQSLNFYTRSQYSSQVTRSRHRRNASSFDLLETVGEAEDSDHDHFPDNWSTAREKFEQIQDDDLKAEVEDSLTSCTKLCLVRFFFLITSTEDEIVDDAEKSESDNERYRVLFSSLTYNLRLEFKSKSNEKKVGFFLVDGLCFQVGESNLFYTGKLHQPSSEIFEDSSILSRKRSRSPYDLANIFKYELVDSSQSFFEAKFSLNFKNGNIIKSDSLNSRPFLVSVSMAQIRGSIDTHSCIQSYAEIVHSHIPTKRFLQNLTIWTKEDDRALDFFEQMKSEYAFTITKSRRVDVFFELKGMVLFLSTSNMVPDGIFLRTGPTFFHIGSTSSLKKTLSRQSNRLLEVERTLRDTQGNSSMVGSSQEKIDEFYKLGILTLWCSFIALNGF